MVAERYLDFLHKHASTLPHSGRTLIHHLVGTHDLLQKWGNSESVCLAGLFHSIYGTQIYKHQAVPRRARPAIARLIGPEAERMAFTFGTIARPKALLDPDAIVWFSRGYLNNLLEIETANLIEQGGSKRWLPELAKTPISPAAKAAIAEWQEVQR